MQESHLEKWNYQKLKLGEVGTRGANWGYPSPQHVMNWFVGRACERGGAGKISTSRSQRCPPPSLHSILSPCHSAIYRSVLRKDCIPKNMSQKLCSDSWQGLGMLETWDVSSNGAKLEWDGTPLCLLIGEKGYLLCTLFKICLLMLHSAHMLLLVKLTVVFFFAPMWLLFTYHKNIVCICSLDSLSLDPSGSYSSLMCIWRRLKFLSWKGILFTVHCKNWAEIVIC